MLNIKQIELKFTFGILDAGTVRILNLGPASEARWDGVSKAEERNFLFEHFGELRALRAWAYQTHVPNKDVEQLGDFVQAVSPQEFTNPSNPGIGVRSPLRAVGFRIRAHGTKFQDFKRAAALTHSGLAKKNGATRIEANGQGGEKSNGREKQ